MLPEHNYAKQWNLDKDGSLWLIAPGSIDQVGCIHTCQGLELEYVGVIIGPDLIARDGQLMTAPDQRARQDRSIRGYKRLLKADPEGTKQKLDRLIRNTYRTLLSRGMKGCYVFCVDAATRDYFRNSLREASEAAFDH